MFDKVLEKAEEAMTQLSKTLSAFEQDYSQLKIKFDDEMRLFNKLSTDEINNRKGELEQLLFNYKAELAHIQDQHKVLLKDEIEASLKDFSKTVKDRFESLYAEYEVEAVKRAEGSFETDVTEMFKKYGDKFAPYIFKALMRYIFGWIRIRRK